MDDEDSLSGPFTEVHDDEDILQYVESTEVVTTKEVAEEFDYHLQTARRRLKDLEDEGRLKKKDVGKRYVWWPNK